MTPEERMRLSLEGLALGDAFGERFFGPPGLVASRIEARELPPAPWPWTDDTAMALSVCEVLALHGRIEQASLARAFARRFRVEPNRGYGGGAREVLTAIAQGASWAAVSHAAFGGGGSMGNGGAMRAAPVGAYFADDVPRATEEARRSAEVTHAHPDGQAGAIAVAVAAALTSSGVGATELLRATTQHVPPGPTRDGLTRAAALPFDTSPMEAAAQLGCGSRCLSMDTVPFALWCAARHLDDYEAALWCTVSGLGDRDTTCAIAGGVVALRVGADGLPAQWLERREALEALA